MGCLDACAFFLVHSPHTSCNHNPQGMTFGIVWKFLDECIFRGQCPEMLTPSNPIPVHSPLHYSSAHTRDMLPAGV